MTIIASNSFMLLFAVALLSAALGYLYWQNMRLQQKLTKLLVGDKKRSISKNNQELAFYDAASQLPNQRLFLDHLSFEIMHSKAPPKMIVVIKLSVNNLKESAALYGQDFANHYFQELTLRLKNIVLETTIVARTQEEEFSILESEFRYVSEVLNFVYRLRAVLCTSYEYLNQSVIGKIAIGVALYPNDSEKVSELYDYATVALQLCTRNQSDYEFYQQSVNLQVKAQKSLINDLYEAVKLEQFYLVYQPQVNIQENNKLIGAEVLIRWEHPTRGLVPPNVFIPLAEEAGLIYKIDEWVLEHACRQISLWQRHGLQIKLAVNISADHFNQPSFIAKISKLISEFGVNPSLLELEITETAVMLEIVKALEHMNEIKSMGLSLALDDFGTGYSSLGYLRQFPVDKLKIEASFVKEIVTNMSDSALTKGIIHLGHDLGLKILAEAVEHKEQLDLLKSFGCDMVQGYYFSRPLTTKAFEKYVKEQLG
jgi:diguanylate cyclase (GGDEF)-like protein